MVSQRPLTEFAPLFEPDQFTTAEHQLLSPFFTNLDQSVYVPLIFSPEVIGALCSRTSRAPRDLRAIFLNEYIAPFLGPEGGEYGQALQSFIDFLHQHSIEEIFANPRAHTFYAKWLAQYGDDSITQMAGMHLVFSSLSQLAIKHFEDQRIGLAPIEKSTRYVDWRSKIKGQYRYYTDPTLQDLNCLGQYRAAMDTLFDTYSTLLPRLTEWLTRKFSQEKPAVVEKKAFDTLRGLLPVATLSQVAFFGNGQSFEYLVSRSAAHSLGEIRWAAQRAYEELYKITPSFLRRLKDQEKQLTVENYQEYLAHRSDRVAAFLPDPLQVSEGTAHPTVSLVEHDPDGEAKVIAGMLFSASNNHTSWSETLAHVRHLSPAERRQIIGAYFAGRTERWQKVGRALENVYVRFEIVMNIGAWRDLHRHRMLTQQRQLFNCQHGYDVPLEMEEAGLSSQFREAIERAAAVQEKIAVHDPVLAQYAVPLAARLRFMQWTNLRECFWEIELRTIPEGHPDYRRIEQEKFRLLERVYPLLMERMRVNLGEYDFARRGQEEKIQAKLRELAKVAQSR